MAKGKGRKLKVNLRRIRDLEDSALEGVQGGGSHVCAPAPSTDTLCTLETTACSLRVTGATNHNQALRVAR